MSKPTILVTGGAGFIGSQVNKVLQEAGYETIVLDDLSTGTKEAVTRGKLIIGDIADQPLLREIFNTYPIQAVIHLAASIDVGESIQNPSKYFKNNFEKTMSLIEVMNEFHIQLLIFSSTAAVYGEPEKIPVDESHPTQPINPYGESKLKVEEAIANTDGLKYISLRYFNAAGGDPDHEIPNLKPKESNLIPIVLRRLKEKNGTITINGTDYATEDGTCIRDYIHIDDLAQAHRVALDHLINGGDSGIFNLGNGRGFSVREVIASAEKITGRKVEVKEGPRREGDPQKLIADCTKAQTVLGWKQQYPDIDQMVRHGWEALNPQVFK